MDSFLRKYIPPVLIVLLLSIPAQLSAQQPLPPSWQDYLEQWVELSSESSSDLMEEELTQLYNTYIDSPVNLNDTLSDPLAPFFFISPLQRACLKAYIEQTGPLLSVNELYLVNLFDSLTVELLKNLVCTKPIQAREHISLKDLARHSRHNLVVGSNGSIEKARGYKEEIYEGDPFRLYFRYQYRYRDRIQLQFSGDKDPGEAFFAKSQTQGFDHYGFHLLLNDFGPIKQAIIGHYHLQFGQGVTLWSGFAPYSAWGTSSYRNAQGIRPASAFTEYSYLTGAAATIALLKHLELTTFYSHTPLDATIPSSLEGVYEDGYPLVQSLYQSGYHRTQTEIKKKDQINEQLWGGHLQYHLANLTVGLTAYKMLYDKKIRPGNYQYNYYYFRGYHNWDVGVDAAYRTGNLLLFGELSKSENKHLAGVMGVEYHFNTDHRISITYRDLDAYYWNQHCGAIGTANERGLKAELQTKLPLGIHAMALFDGTYYPEMKYAAYAPSRSLDTRLRLMRNIGSHMEIALQYRFNRQGSNVKDNGIYHIEDADKHQIQSDIKFNLGDFHSVTRLAYSKYHLDESSHGFLIYEDLVFEPQRIPLQLAARICLFDITDYDARIYSAEHGLAYDNSSLFYQGRGERFYLVLHWKATRHISIGAKYSIINYTDRETIGSSYELIQSPYRQQWKIQLRFQF